MGQNLGYRWLFVSLSMMSLATFAFGQEGSSPRDVHVSLTPCGIDTFNEEIVMREAFEFNPGDRLIAVLPTGFNFNQHTFAFTRGWNQPWGDADYPAYVNAGVSSSGQALVWIQDLYDTYGEDIFQRPFIRVVVVVPEVYTNQVWQCGIYFYRGDGSDAEVNALIREENQRFYYVGPDPTTGASGGTWIGNGSERVTDGKSLGSPTQDWDGSSSGAGLELGIPAESSSLTAYRLGLNQLNAGGCELRRHQSTPALGSIIALIVGLLAYGFRVLLRRRLAWRRKSL